MATFIISTRDEIDCENEKEAIEWLLEFLEQCVRNEDVSTFNIEKVRS